MRCISVVMVGILLICTATAAAQTDRHAPLRQSAKRLAAEFAAQPQAPDEPGQPIGKIATALGLVAGGVAMVVLGKPDLTPSRFTPSVVPSLVDLNAYLDPLSRRRGDDHGSYSGVECRGRRTGVVCPADVGAINQLLETNYDNGFVDGYDDGMYDGQVAVVDLLDENGFQVYGGQFVAAKYVQERLKDPQGMRIGGAALIAAGAIAALMWPDSGPVESIAAAPLLGGGWVGATVGF